jgi:hypothetical protein
MKTITDLEVSLNVKAPDWYKDLLLRHIKDDKSQKSSDMEICKDFGFLIEINNDYRNGRFGQVKWKDNLLIIGIDGAASTYVIDLKSERKEILLFDHGNPDDVLDVISNVDEWIEWLNEDSIEVKNGKNSVFLGIGIALVLLFVSYLLMSNYLDRVLS